MKFRFFLYSLIFFSLLQPAGAQKLDSLLSKAEQWKLKHLLRGLNISVYFDAYYEGNIGGTIPTSHTYEFMLNSPYINEARLNMFDVTLNYNNSWARLTAEYRIGDQPLLLSSTTAQWTNYITQASLGFTFGKGFWIDFGYLDSQMGVESSMPINNLLSTCTVGSYFEPNSMLGAYLSFVSKDEKWTAGIWAGNPFSLPYGKNTHVNYGADVSYNPTDNLTISYNNYMGNIAQSGAKYYKNLLYNNLYVTYDPGPKWDIVGQTDFAFQRVTSMEKDSVKRGMVISALVASRFYFLPKFAFALRAEVFYDPKNILIGNKYNGKTDDFIIFGASAGLEFNPGKDAYFRIQYNYLTTGDPGVKPFNEVVSDNPVHHYYADYFRQCYTLTTGIRF